MRSLLVLLIACGPRAPTPTTDFGPPPREVDPIVCPEALLDRFALRVGAPLHVELETIVEAARIDQAPCKPGEPDEACLARARQRPIPAGYVRAGLAIGGDARVTFTYELDGRVITEEAPNLQDMVSKLKGLQADGHEVLVIRGESTTDEGTRHAAITYRPAESRQRRVATLRWHPDDRSRAMAEAQAAIAREAMEVRRFEATDDGELVLIATCGPGSRL